MGSGRPPSRELLSELADASSLERVEAVLRGLQGDREIPLEERDEFERLAERASYLRARGKAFLEAFHAVADDLLRYRYRDP